MSWRCPWLWPVSSPAAAPPVRSPGFPATGPGKRRRSRDWPGASPGCRRRPIPVAAAAAGATLSSATRRSKSATTWLGGVLAAGGLTEQFHHLLPAAIVVTHHQHRGDGLDCSTRRSAESLPAALTRIRSGASAGHGFGIGFADVQPFHVTLPGDRAPLPQEALVIGESVVGRGGTAGHHGAPMASRAPVRVTLVETIRCGLAGRVTWLPSVLICRGQSAARAGRPAPGSRGPGWV